MSQSPSDVYIAPPMAGGEWVEPPEPPKWPKVVGIISIVLGSLSVVCSGCGVAMLFFLPAMMSGAEAQAGPLPPSMQAGPMQIGSYVIGALLAILLIVAGVMLVSRRPVARGLYLLYSSVAILAALFSFYLIFDMQRQMDVFAANNPDSPFVQQRNPTMEIAIGVILVIAFGLAWPIFCLVWFGAVKKRPDDITGGIEEPAA